MMSVNSERNCAKHATPDQIFGDIILIDLVLLGVVNFKFTRYLSLTFLNSIYFLFDINILCCLIIRSKLFVSYFCIGSDPFGLVISNKLLIFWDGDMA